MLYARDIKAPVFEVVDRLHKSAANHQFGVLGTIDLKAKMNEKGVPFESPCVILEVCNPGQAARVLAHNLEISTALPCRISVYERNGMTTVATIRPTMLLKMYAGSEPIADVARSVEDTLIAIIDEA